MRPGPVERRTHDYLRYGTVSLFAALDAQSGKVIGRCHRRHRPVEFRKFLDTIEVEVPADLDVHLIVDNYATHKTALIRNWLAKRPAIPVALHAHQRVLAEPGGKVVCAADGETTASWGASKQRRTGGRHLPLSGYHQRRPQAFCLDQDRRPNLGQRRPLSQTNFGYMTLEFHVLTALVDERTTPHLPSAASCVSKIQG